MAKNKSCPECGHEPMRSESGTYAMIKTQGGRIDLHTDAARTVAMVVEAMICPKCRFVKLYDV
jgi:ribosomal protein S27AE